MSCFHNSVRIKPLYLILLQSQTTAKIKTREPLNESTDNDTITFDKISHIAGRISIVNKGFKRITHLTESADKNRLRVADERAAR